MSNGNENNCSSTPRRKRQDDECESTRQFCATIDLRGVDNMAISFETDPRLQTQNTTNLNMGAVTSITRRRFRRQNGTIVDLVYVMRARISSSTLQPRESFGHGIAKRMRELNALPSDERGHILASTLGGPKDVINIIPQAAKVNRVTFTGDTSFWRIHEEDLRKMITQHPGSYINWLIVLNYGNLIQEDLRPTEFVVSHVTHYANGALQSGHLAFSNQNVNCELLSC